MSQTLSRRSCLGAAATLAGAGLAGWAPAVARELAARRSTRHCVLLWMTGGPSQTDTFDMKPGHANGGPFKEIPTSVPGLRISEHLPKLAALGEHLAILRGMSTAEGDHGRGTFLMRTGHRPEGPIQFPTLGSLVANELQDEAATLPAFVSIAPNRNFNRRAFQSGFLGPRCAPLTVGTRPGLPVAVLEQTNQFAELGVDDLRSPPEVSSRQERQRLDLLRRFQSEFVSSYNRSASRAHDMTVQRAVRMVHGEDAASFDLSREPDAVREAYGRGRFGQGCLMARRLIERGVPFVEVCLGDDGRWDTHAQAFPAIQTLSAELDAGWSMLMKDLRDRGLLESTTILWMGEFGRTPQINQNAGRDHFPQAWSTVLAGGGIRGGQAYGRTNAGGTSVEDGNADVGDLLATLVRALEIDPRKQNVSEVGRPIRIAEGTPIADVLERGA